MIFFKKNICVLFFVVLYSHSCLWAMKNGIFVNTFSQNMCNIIDIDKDSKNANPINLYVINEEEPKSDLMTRKLGNALLDQKADFNILVYYKTVENLLAINGFVPNATTLTTNQAIFLESMLANWNIMHVSDTGYVLFMPQKSNTLISFGGLTTFTYQLNTLLNREQKAFNVMKQLNWFLTFVVVNGEKKHCNAVYNELEAIKKMAIDAGISLIAIDADFKLCKKNKDGNNFSLNIVKREKILNDCIVIINKACDFFKKEFYPEKYYKEDVQHYIDDLTDKKNTLSAWGSFNCLSFRERKSPISVWHEAKLSVMCAFLYIVQKMVFSRMNYFDKKSGLPNALATVFKALGQNQQNSISTKKITMYLTGHGSSASQIIANLNPDDILALLFVCKNYGVMHTLVVDSCFTTGKNRQWLLDLAIKFPLVFIGVDNLPTLSILHVKENYPRLIFDQLNASLKDIEALYNLFIDGHPAGSLQKVENAPFIFDPASMMNIFGTQEACYFLDKARMSSKTKIILPPVSFLYAAENCMDTTLNIGTKKYRGNSALFLTHLLDGVPLTGKEFALFNPKIGAANPVVKSTVKEEDKGECMNLFPAFVPYDQKNGACFYIKKIKTYGDSGVFKTIRDMFLNGGRLYSSRNIFIESIEGENDLLQTLQESRRVNGIQEASDLEKILSDPQNYPVNKLIKLSRIYINITPSSNGNVKYEVSCALGHKVWQWTHDTKDIAASIDFQEIAKPVAYKNNFNSEVEKIKPKKNVTPQFLPVQPNVIQPNVITITTNTPTQVPTSTASSSSQQQLQKQGVKRKEREE